MTQWGSYESDLIVSPSNDNPVEVQRIDPDSKQFKAKF